MSDGLVVIAAPAMLPVTLTAAKAHVRVDSNDDDATLTGFIEAAVAYAERFMGRALVDQTFELTLDAVPAGGAPVKLPRPPLIEVLEVAAVDSAGNETPLTGYRVDTAQAPGRLLAPASGWPQGSGLRIRYRAGYIRMEGSPPAAVGDVPADINAALMLYVGSLYMQRETLAIGTVSVVPWSAEQLLRNHRVEVGFA